MIYKNFSRILDIIFIFLGIISISYYLILKSTFGHTSFSIVFFIFGLILMSYGISELTFNINYWNKLSHKLKIIIKVIFSIGISIFIVIEGMILYNGQHKDLTKPDYLLVLGAGLKGHEIKTSLKHRLDTTLEFNKIYPDLKIIVSGGQGPDEDISEAKAMKDYLTSHGIDENLIIMEDNSTNTYENFLFTKDVLDKITNKNDYTLTIISNGFHMYRAKYLGEKVGFKCLGYPAPSEALTSFNFYIREFFGVIKAYILNN